MKNLKKAILILAVTFQEDLICCSVDEEQARHFIKLTRKNRDQTYADIAHEMGVTPHELRQFRQGDVMRAEKKEIILNKLGPTLERYNHFVDRLMDFWPYIEVRNERIENQLFLLAHDIETPKEYINYSVSPHNSQEHLTKHRYLWYDPEVRDKVRIKMHHIVCKRCGVSGGMKNGFMRGKQRYKCIGCRYNFTLTQPRGKHPALKALATLLYGFAGVSMAKIARLVGVSEVAVYKWMQTAGQVTRKTNPKEAEIIMIDEMWHYVNGKKRKFGSGKPMTLYGAKSLPGIWVLVATEV